MATIGNTYQRRKKKYTLKHVEDNPRFTYYYMLPEDFEDIPQNYMVFGSRVFREEFNLIKEVKDGWCWKTRETKSWGIR